MVVFISLLVAVLVLAGLGALMLTDAGQAFLGGCGMLVMLLGIGSFALVAICVLGFGCAAVLG